jgi:hypothetical protein
MLKEGFEIKSEMNEGQVLLILENGISGKFQFFPNSIMYGQISRNNIKAVINPPLGYVDPFKSRVHGELKTQNDLTIIKVKVFPSWIVIGFILLWLILIVVMIATFDYANTIEVIKFLILTFLLISFPFVIARLKVHWDRKRLERWMTQKIRTKNQ